MREKKPAAPASIPFILSLLDESEEELHALGIAPQHLAAIYNDYLTRQSDLTSIATFVARVMQQAEGVHSVKYRVKEPQHLLRKIVRKKREYPHRTITPQNYLHLLNDLAGVRVLHLYKENWASIGNYIQQKWDLKRTPYAYVKTDEAPTQAGDFEKYGCKVVAHPSGYKAVHFVIETKPDKQRYFVEIQLRTLFEEGWSEIDHHIRYPDHDNSELLALMLQLLNKLTSKADEVVTSMVSLTKELEKYKKQGKTTKLSTTLHKYVDNLPIREDDKQQLYTCINSIAAKK